MDMCCKAAAPLSQAIAKQGSDMWLILLNKWFLELYLSWAKGSDFNISDLAKCNGLFSRGGSTILRFYNRSPCISEAMHWSPCLYKEEESYSLWKMAVGVCQVILVLNFHLSLCGWSALAKTLCDLFAWSAAGKQLCSVCSIHTIPYFIWMKQQTARHAAMAHFACYTMLEIASFGFKFNGQCGAT